jgi:hypothetical protein
MSGDENGYPCAELNRRNITSGNVSRGSKEGGAVSDVAQLIGVKRINTEARDSHCWKKTKPSHTLPLPLCERSGKYQATKLTLLY